MEMLLSAITKLYLTKEWLDDKMIINIILIFYLYLRLNLSQMK
jgi:hypothetical protein